MKKAKIVISVIVTVLLLIYPAIRICAMVKTDEKYKRLIYNTSFISVENVKYNSQDSRFLILYMNGSDINESYNSMSSELFSDDRVISVEQMNMNPEFVSDIYSGCQEPDYEYSDIKDGDITHKQISFKNGESYIKTKGSAFSSYTLTEYFAKAGLLSIIEGQMIDFDKDYTKEDAVEVVVTDGMGYSVGDILYVVLNALNEENEQVFVKAKVVGITQKGVFLPCYPGYLGFFSYVDGTYDEVFNTEMIYLPDISELYTYNYSPGNSANQTTQTGIMTAFYNEDGAAESVADIMKKHGCANVKSNTYGFSCLGNYGQSFREEYLTDGIIIIALCLVICIAETVFICSSVKKTKSK